MGGGGGGVVGPSFLREITGRPILCLVPRSARRVHPAALCLNTFLSSARQCCAFTRAPVSLPLRPRGRGPGVRGPGVRGPGVRGQESGARDQGPGTGLSGAVRVINHTRRATILRAISLPTEEATYCPPRKKKQKAETVSHEKRDPCPRQTESASRESLRSERGLLLPSRGSFFIVMAGVL